MLTYLPSTKCYPPSIETKRQQQEKSQLNPPHTPTTQRKHGPRNLKNPGSNKCQTNGKYKYNLRSAQFSMSIPAQERMRKHFCTLIRLQSRIPTPKIARVNQVEMLPLPICGNFNHTLSSCRPAQAWVEIVDDDIGRVNFRSQITNPKSNQKFGNKVSLRWK